MLTPRHRDRGLVALLVALVVFLGTESPASAHTGFQSSDPAEVSTVDNLTWTLHFDEPLAGGVVGVRWQVAAPDAHPIERC